MNKKDLILLAKEVYPELFDQNQKEIQEQIIQLLEPISHDEPDRSPKVDLEAITNKLEQQNRDLVAALEKIANPPITPPIDKNYRSVEIAEQALAQVKGDQS